MTTPGLLNAQGDRLVATTGLHGADIASQRIDELDRHALAWLLERSDRRPVYLELGCGLGTQGMRAALLGAEALLIDLMPPTPLLQAMAQEPGVLLRHRTLDLQGLGPEHLPARIDLTFSQRTLHYLPFEQAARVVALCAGVMAPGSEFLVSVSGLDSELGQAYPAAALPLAQRFATLAPEVAARHGILEPVCLYREDDLATLMGHAALRPVRLWRSAFGNVKGVFRSAA